MDLIIYCGDCGPSVELFRSTQTDESKIEEWRRAWKDSATAGHGGTALYSRIQCHICGAAYRIEDDGQPFEAGGFVITSDITSPQITGINVPTGPRTGGVAVFVTGSSLDIGTLVVKFDGKIAAVDQRTPTSARAITPSGSYRLNVAEECHRLVLTPLLGAFSVDEGFTSNVGSTGIIRRINGQEHTITFAALLESLEDLVGTNIVGASGAVATVASISAPSFQAGEMVSGSISAAVAVVRTSSPFVVDAPTGAFVEDELVLGATSGAVVKLAPSAPYSGAVEISVENEYGRRATNHTLVGAFTYL